MQHYANYRSQIRRMSDNSSFVPSMNENGEVLNEAKPISSSSFYPLPEILQGEDEQVQKPSSNPYRDYLRRRRRVYIAQLIVFLVLVIGFAIWAIILMRRS